MKDRQVFIFIPGILSKGLDAWVNRAVTHVHTRTDHRAEKLPYWAGPLTRRFRQRRRVRGLLKMMDYYLQSGYTINLIGHSNGCDIIRRALITYGDKLVSLKLGHIHMIAAAIPACFDDNGLNSALTEGVWHHTYIRLIHLTSLHLYIDPADTALWWGGLTRKTLGWAGLGYGDLGRRGPIEPVASIRKIIHIHKRPGIGHSGWFATNKFHTTMDNILHPRSK